jgi:RimJ/RimL family protein N-acetyltransferase
MKNDVRLRDVTGSDLTIFFDYQLDSDANHMAAFTAKETDREAFVVHWAKILRDDTIMIRTVLFEEHVAGYLASFERLGKPEVRYWIGKEYWGKGVATKALSQFLGDLKTRPLYSRAAKDNIASIRVLEKCGFAICGKDKGFANARSEEVEEFILKLSAPERQEMQ